MSQYVAYWWNLLQLYLWLLCNRKNYETAIDIDDLVGENAHDIEPARVVTCCSLRSDGGTLTYAVRI